MQSVIIIGNSITAEVLHSLMSKDERYKVEGFAVDKEFISEDKFQGLGVVDIKDIPNLFDKSEIKIVLAVGYKNQNKNREKIYNRILDSGYEIISYIHKDAIVHTEDIGNGCVLMPGAVVDPCCKIGNNTVIWSNAICAHHSTVGDNCWIGSGSVLSGQVKVGSNTFIGVGAIIVNEVVVGDYNIIGAGALITRCTNADEVFLTKAGEKIPFNSKEYAKTYGY
jgi:sugar O-acyltransferase (sialic acid O-acetyltransferase NeuD family)